MARDSSPSSSRHSDQPVPADAGPRSHQKHYSSSGGGGGYSPEDHRYQHHYGNSQYPGPPPPLPRGHYHPPHHGGAYHHRPPPPQSYYYPQHASVPPPPSHPASSSRRGEQSSRMPPSLVTPKSHDDSETVQPPSIVMVAAETAATKKGRNGNKKKKSPAKSSTSKSNNNCISGRKESNSTTSSKLHSTQDIELDEELTVDPMKQDFHFYAMDNYEQVKQICESQLAKSIANGSILQKDKENQLHLLTTLINTRLLQNWEAAPTSTREAYLKKEEADRKRFMSEEEVASRHCATLTARKRSPKQTLGATGSFGLTSVPSLLPSDDIGGRGKRTCFHDGDDMGGESLAKRAKMGV